MFYVGIFHILELYPIIVFIFLLQAPVKGEGEHIYEGPAIKESIHIVFRTQTVDIVSPLLLAGQTVPVKAWWR